MQLANGVIVEGVVRGNYWQNLQVRREGVGKKGKGRSLGEQEEKKSLVIYHLKFLICHLDSTDFMLVKDQLQPNIAPPSA